MQVALSYQNSKNCLEADCFAWYNYFVYNVFALPLKSECKLFYQIKTVQTVLK